MAEASSPASPDHLHSDEVGNQGGGDRDNSEVREQDKLLPIANIARIMRRVLPAHAKLSQDSKQTVQECTSEFIGFITDQANVMCKQEKRKTINGDDILRAMSYTGFDNYEEPLKVYLDKYREIEDQAKGSGMNTPRAEDSWKKEGGGAPMPTGVQMGPGGVNDGDMPYTQPDSYEMLAALRNQQFQGVKRL